jgi:hypothetical protein
VPRATAVGIDVQQTRQKAVNVDARTMYGFNATWLARKDQRRRKATTAERT